MSHPTKKQQSLWAKKTLDAVITLGAVPDKYDDPEYNYRSFEAETIYGRLRLFPCHSAIRTRFDVVPPIHPTGAPLNPYSGKWNFEFGLIPEQQELDWAVRCIKGVLA